MNKNPPAEPAQVLLPPALPIGHCLHGFELQAELEADGVVDDCRSYRAWDLALQRPVVVTEYLPPALARRGEAGEVSAATSALAPAYAAGLDHFLAQTRCLAQADHPHLLRVLHVLLAQGTAYRVHPSYPGQCLQRLRQRMPGPPDAAVLLGLLHEMLAALQVFHDAGTVHGAVHPGRILVLDDDSSLLLAPRTGGSALADTYAAPELQSKAAAAPVGAWSDCHALARVARYCITGEVPAPHLDAASPPLAMVVDGLSAAHRAMRYPPGLLHVLDLAADIDIARRPQTATEFREWLDQARPTPAPRPVLVDDEVATRAVRSVIAALPPRDLVGERIEPPPFAPPFAPPLTSTFPPPIPPTRTDMAADAVKEDPASLASAPAPTKARALALASVTGLATAAVMAWIWWLPAEPALTPASSSNPMSQVTPAMASVQAPAAAPPVTVAAAPVADFDALPAPAAGPAPTAIVETPPPVQKPARQPAPQPAPTPALPAATTAAAKAVGQTRSPRESCGERTPFSLYRCMQRECSAAASRQHPQCVQLRRTDRVD